MTRMASQSLLTESMGYSNIQHNKKPFSLSFCKKKFVLKDDVKENEKIHMKEKLFSCTFCKKKFVLKDDRKGSTLEKSIYLFDQKKFVLIDNLKENEKINTEEKPFSCSFCEKNLS